MIGLLVRRVFFFARLLACAAWAAFAAWLFVYAMPLSGLLALLGLWALLPFPLAPTALSPGARRAAGWAVVAVGTAAVPLVGLPEYAATTNALHCRALGFMGVAPSADCDRTEVERGSATARSGGPLFTARERLGVHGFNHLLALGGLVVGLPEVAWETAAMSWSPNPLPDAASAEQRRSQCSASHGLASARKASLAPSREAGSDFAMRSPEIRRTLRALLSTNPGTPQASAVHFLRQGYGGVVRRDSLRVALALEVGDSALAAIRRNDGRIEAAWTGTIHYPGGDVAFSVELPTALGPRVLRVSEAVFCGMQVDGAMAPYPLTFRWTLAPDDPRLAQPEVDRPDRGWLEALVAMASAR
ncbi:MAG: hypothetical protein QM765_30130 [Myxococcales bacterium]